MAVCIGSGLTVDGTGQLITVNPPACKVYHSVAQSLASGTETTVAFNSEEYDNGTMHDNAVNNNRITFTTAGVYVITAMIEFAAASDYTLVHAFIRVNGSSANIIDLNTRAPWANAGFQPTVDLYTHFKFAAGDYIEMRARQTNSAAAARNIVAYDGNQRSPVMAVARVAAG